MGGVTGACSRGGRSVAMVMWWLVLWTCGVRWAWAGTLPVNRVTVTFPVSDCTPYRLIPVQIAMCDSFVALAKFPAESTTCILPLFTCGPRDAQRRKLLQDDFEFFTMVIEVAEGSEEEIEDSTTTAANDPETVQEGAVEQLRSQGDEEAADDVEGTTVLPGTVQVEQAEPEGEECETDADCDEYDTPYCLRGDLEEPQFTNLCVECLEDSHCAGLDKVCIEFQCVFEDSPSPLAEFNPPPQPEAAQTPPTRDAAPAPPLFDSAQIEALEVTLTIYMHECSFVHDPLVFQAMCDSAMALAGFNGDEASCNPKKAQCSSDFARQKRQYTHVASVAMQGFQRIPLEDVDMAFSVALGDPQSTADFVHLVSYMLANAPDLVNSLQDSNITNVTFSVRKSSPGLMDNTSSDLTQHTPTGQSATPARWRAVGMLVALDIFAHFFLTLH